MGQEQDDYDDFEFPDRMSQRTLTTVLAVLGLGIGGALVALVRFLHPGP